MKTKRKEKEKKKERKEAKRKRFCPESISRPSTHRAQALPPSSLIKREFKDILQFRQ